MSARTEASEKASDVKRAQRHLRRGVAQGVVSVPSIIEDTPEFARSMRLDTLLFALPDWGMPRIEMFCSRQRVPPSIELRALTVRQRLALSKALRFYYGDD